VLVAEIVAPHPRHGDAVLDAHRLVHHPPLLRVIAHFDLAIEREILAQRVPDETVIGEDAPQVRVAVENDAEQVEGLALEPVGSRPHIDHRTDQREGVVQQRTHAQTPVLRGGQQVIDHGEARLPVSTRKIGVIDAADVDQLIESQRRQVTQLLTDGRHIAGCQLHRHLLTRPDGDPDQTLTQLLAQRRHQLLGPRAHD
jgi:hypothetical protein